MMIILIYHFTVQKGEAKMKFLTPEMVSELVLNPWKLKIDVLIKMDRTTGHAYIKVLNNYFFNNYFLLQLLHISRKENILTL